MKFALELRVFFLADFLLEKYFVLDKPVHHEITHNFMGDY